MKHLFYLVIACLIFARQSYADDRSHRALGIGLAILGAPEDTENGANCSSVEKLTVCTVYSVMSDNQAVVVFSHDMQVLASFLNKNAYKRQN